MKLIALSILLGSALIALAVFFSPSSQRQVVYGDGYLYVMDLPGKNIANIIPGMTRMKSNEE
jgi:hypothetical protein